MSRTCQFANGNLQCPPSTYQKTEQEETKISPLNIYVLSHSELKYDIVPESSIKCGRISLTHAAERTTPAVKGYEYEKIKDAEGTRILCDVVLEKLMQLSELESWVST